MGSGWLSYLLDEGRACGQVAKAFELSPTKYDDQSGREKTSLVVDLPGG